MNFNKFSNLKKKYDINLTNKKFINLKLFNKLTLKKKKTLGKSNLGSIITRFKGGGHKRKYRLLNFNKHKLNYIGLVRFIIYDPNRSSFIKLIQTKSGLFFFSNCVSHIKENTLLIQNSNSLIPLSLGNILPLKQIPNGINISNIEKYRGSGAIFCKSAGNSATILKKELNFVTILLPSGRKIKLKNNCLAVIGNTSNLYYNFHKKYKAGTNRYLNKRPHVRGVAMNPVDHPHGGGEGKSSGGRPSVSP